MKTLPFGTFNGERCKGLDLNGLVVGEFRDRPEDTITQHTHEDTHFQFLLKGLYVTGAEGLESPCSPPTVIFNPAGTRHRDRFEIRGGSFLALSVTRNIMARIQNDCVALESAQSASLEVKFFGSGGAGSENRVFEGTRNITPPQAVDCYFS